MQRTALIRLLLWTLVSALAALCTGVRAEPSPALLLDDSTASVDAWPALRLLTDPGRTMTLDDARRRVAEFRPPDGPEANLGPRLEAVWLHLSLRVVGGDGQWLLDIAYPALNQADVYLFSDGRLVLQRRLGAAQPYAQRPMPGRTHLLPLSLSAGTDHQLYLRVVTQSAMVLPITLNKPDAYHAREASHQLLIGLMLGVALTLLVYSLAHGLSLRNGLFGLYALMLLGSTVFLLEYQGIAQQWLDFERSGLAGKASPLALLAALAAGAQFVARALDTVSQRPRIHQGLMALSALALLLFGLSLLDVLDYRLTQAAVGLLGPLVPLLTIPAAWSRARQGDRASQYMLFGWGSFLIGALTMAGLIRGLLPANVWTLNAFQWTSVVEMLAWLRVLSLHIEAVRRQAERTELERQTLQSLAHTDALTGLPNRRGLALGLERALPLCRADSALVLFLLDLDGFKAVNDRLGHDVGDALLVQVSQRLRSQVRREDLVARLGGDEFVIAANGIGSEAEAMALGRKLLEAFGEPFDVAGQTCRVGITIGFALAPHDGNQAGDLLKRADAAMYAGKQAGRHTLRRGAASPGLVS